MQIESLSHETYILCPGALLSHHTDSYYDEIQNLQFCILPNCYNLSTDFRTVFVFALGPFLPMWVLFFTSIRISMGKWQTSVTYVLQTSSKLCWAIVLYVVLLYGKERSQSKKKLFQNHWTNCNNLGACKIANFDFHQNKNSLKSIHQETVQFCSSD